MRCRSASLASLVVALIYATPGARAQASVHAERTDSLLDRLVGEWVMQGHVRGSPVEYTLDVARTIQDRYVELHMVDVGRPSRYEARVIIGQTARPYELIAHWIDNFGAEYSVPPATGALRGDTLVLDFPYPDGAFHDLFVYDRKLDRWRFTLDAANGRGGWRRFAEYDVLRRPKATR